LIKARQGRPAAFASRYKGSGSPGPLSFLGPNALFAVSVFDAPFVVSGLGAPHARHGPILETAHGRRLCLQGIRTGALWRVAYSNPVFSFSFLGQGHGSWQSDQSRHRGRYGVYGRGAVAPAGPASERAAA